MCSYFGGSNTSPLTSSNRPDGCRGNPLTHLSDVGGAADPTGTLLIYGAGKTGRERDRLGLTTVTVDIFKNPQLVCVVCSDLDFFSSCCSWMSGWINWWKVTKLNSDLLLSFHSWIFLFVFIALQALHCPVCPVWRCSLLLQDLNFSLGWINYVCIVFGSILRIHVKPLTNPSIFYFPEKLFSNLTFRRAAIADEWLHWTDSWLMRPAKAACSPVDAEFCFGFFWS